MTWQQDAILAVLGCTLAAFVWDRWRYDVVAITSLSVGVLLGLIEPERAFAGFSNPAVITVAAVLVISRALARSGAIEALAGRLIGASGSHLVHLASLCVLGARGGDGEEPLRCPRARTRSPRDAAAPWSTGCFRRRKPNRLRSRR